MEFACHEKLKGLCKTRLAGRHSCLKIFGELCEHKVTCLNAMVNSYVYPDVIESRWDWDSDTQGCGSWFEKWSAEFLSHCWFHSIEE